MVQPPSIKAFGAGCLDKLGKGGLKLKAVANPRMKADRSSRTKLRPTPRKCVSDLILI